MEDLPWRILEREGEVGCGLASTYGMITTQTFYQRINEKHAQKEFCIGVNNQLQITLLFRHVYPNYMFLIFPLLTLIRSKITETDNTKQYL